MSKKLNYDEMPILNGTAMPEHVYESLQIARKLADDFNHFMYQVCRDFESITQDKQEFWKHISYERCDIKRRLKSDILTVINLMHSPYNYLTECGETNPCSCFDCTREGPFKKHRGNQDVIANYGWGTDVFDFIIEYLIAMCDYFYKEIDRSHHYAIDKQMSPIIWALIPCTAGNL